ncbi:MAG: hypothetical protein JO368_08610 [Acidimicrobiales bacterium]|nr:hypothetical protein [Acidimicrobiales bacterium]
MTSHFRRFTAAGFPIRRARRLMLTILAVLAVLTGLFVVLPDRPAQAATVGDSTQTATLQFYVCPKDCTGIHVFVDSASNHYSPSGDYSNCTRNETSTDFWPSYNGQIVRVSMVAKNGGSCFFERSYNTWLVEVYKNNQRIGRGLVLVDEDNGVTASYFASCDPHASPWKPTWDGLGCKRTTTMMVHISVPGAEPTWPDCPATTKMCAIDLTVGSSARVPCGGFTSSSETCQGTSSGTRGWTVPTYDSRQGIGAWFSWKAAGDVRQVQYQAYLHYAIVQAEITGQVPSPGSDRFSVKDAWIRQSSDHWMTGDTSPAGAPGGPLLFNFDRGTFSNTISFQGFLERK